MLNRLLINNTRTLHLILPTMYINSSHYHIYHTIASQATQLYPNKITTPLKHPQNPMTKSTFPKLSILSKTQSKQCLTSTITPKYSRFTIQTLVSKLCQYPQTSSIHSNIQFIALFKMCKVNNELQTAVTSTSNWWVNPFYLERRGVRRTFWKTINFQINEKVSVNYINLKF